jgi:hypothetical protein
MMKVGVGGAQEGSTAAAGYDDRSFRLSLIIFSSACL